jgi:hypothetical protein
MWPTFDNSVGYWGADVPTQLAARWMPSYGTPAIPYTLIPHQWRTVEDAQWHDLQDGRVSLGGRSAVVIIPTSEEN